MELQQKTREPGRIVAIVEIGLPIAAQVATIDGFPSLAPYYSLGRRLHYSVPVKLGKKFYLCTDDLRLDGCFSSEPFFASRSKG